MAPAAGSKRSRPSFSPPRPGKSKVTKSSTTAKSSAKGKGVSHAKGASKASAKISGKQMARTKPQPRSRGGAGTMRAILDEASDDEDDGDEDEEDDEEEMLDDEDEEEEDGQEEDEANRSRAESAASPLDIDAMSSPEPDFILAEVTYHPVASRTNGKGGRKRGSDAHNQANGKGNNSGGPDGPLGIPAKLVHRIMQETWSANPPNPLKPSRAQSGSSGTKETSMSTDARHLVGKYVDTFVREAIRRCVEEKRERAEADGGGIDSGWLEVEDLERVGVQLCLDF